LIEIERFFLWFLLYSMLGWLYESVMYTVKQRRFINRGFLNGPYCPIYGVGAVMNLLLLGNMQHPVWLFLAGAAVSCTLEYLTSWLMEVLFHARWWDYRKYPLNLNGRICLYGALVFGALSVLLILGLHPLVAQVTQSIPNEALHGICGLFLVILCLDMLTTVGGVRKLNHLLHEAAQSIGHEQWFTHKLGLQQKRMLTSFPSLISTRYNQALLKIRQAYNEFRWKKNAPKDQ